jgi:hypothetical protein
MARNQLYFAEPSIQYIALQNIPNSIVKKLKVDM